jgi:hypothetical protein
MSTNQTDFGNRTTKALLLTKLHKGIWAFIRYCLSFKSTVPYEIFACKPHVSYSESVLCHTNLGSKVVWEQGRGYWN